MVGYETSSRWIGGYHLLTEIGRGGTGTVWQAEDDGGNRVALKLLHPSVAGTEAARTRLLREARLVNQVKSIHVARVLDVEAEAYAPFVVTELIEGPTLDAEITRLPYRAPDAAQLGSELAETLQAVHAAGIAHRDLKPSNVILTSTGPTLIDFGIAHGEGDTHLTQTGAITGTAGYVSPELLRGEDEPNLQLLQAGDWFALNALLLKSMTGRPPFGSGRVEVVLQRVITGQPDTDGLDPQVAEAFRHALSPSPAQRLQTADLLARLSGFPLAPYASTLPFEETAQVSQPTTLMPASSPTSAGPWSIPPTPKPRGSSGPSGWLFTLGFLTILSGLAALWRLPGVVASIAIIALCQVVGQVALDTWQRQAANRSATRQRFLLVPWFALRALWLAIPGVLVGGAAAYLTFALSSLQAGQSWNPSAAIAWVSHVDEGGTWTTLLAWFALTVGLSAYWLLPSSRAARVGVERCTGFNRWPGQWRWLAALMAIAPATTAVIWVFQH